MSVNLEVKGNVARLLATENLIVENKNVETASFNVESRVLTLPMWEKSTDEVYDLLVAHEVSHALYTPNEDWDPEIPHQFLNVTEDVRVEKLIKRRFMGLSKTFYKGYQEFYDEDFFELEGKDINEMNLADRINIYYKIGSFQPVSFTDEEKEIVNLIGAAETFEEAQQAALVLYKYCKKKKEEETPATATGDLPNKSQQGEADSGDSTFENNSQYDDGFDDSEEGDGDSVEHESISDDTDLEVETDTASTQKIKNLVDFGAYPSTYLELPQLDLKEVINSNKVVHDYMEDFWKPIMDAMEPGSDRCIFERWDQDFTKFKTSIQKEVNYLVKEFEMKKSASAYQRATVSRTGVLDCSKLHTYRYNEDLFKKVTTLPDGKNHGLVFILDWSGSMGGVMEATLKQLYCLIWFCKKVGIPFGVYAFTQSFNHFDTVRDERGHVIRDVTYERNDKTLHIGREFSLMEFFTSDTSQSVLDRQLKNIWRVMKAQRSFISAIDPPHMGLSGTPLNETIVTLRTLIPSLQKKWGTEKTQCVLLTDGESNHLSADRWISKEQECYGEQRNDPNYTGRWSTRRLRPDRDFIRSRKAGTTYKVPERWWDFTTKLIQMVKDELPDVNFIGMRLIGQRDASDFIKRYHGNYSMESTKLINEYKKKKSVALKVAGYDAYFGIAAQSLNNDSQFDVEEGATKAKIKSAFIKSLKTKKLNKKVLNEFVELIS